MNKIYLDQHCCYTVVKNIIELNYGREKFMEEKNTAGGMKRGKNKELYVLFND